MLVKMNRIFSMESFRALVEKYDVDEDLIFLKIEDVDSWNAVVDMLTNHVIDHPDYGYLAGELALRLLNTTSFLQITEALRDLLSENYLSKVHKYSEELQLLENTEFAFKKKNIFAIRTLIKGGYLLSSGELIEKPLQMYLRLAISLTRDDVDFLKNVKEYYCCLIMGKISHATPTMMNAGTKIGQLASCFIIASPVSSSVQDVFNSLSESANISTKTGGIGISGHTISDIVKYAKILNASAALFDQGKRPASYNLYIEPWHPDVERFLELKNPVGGEELRARDLFYTLWIPDLFMERLKNDRPWSLMPVGLGLEKLWGVEFNEYYLSLEEQGLGKLIDIKGLFLKILKSLQETGGPSIMFKDNVNLCSNHRYLGTVTGGNLCTEIVQYSDNSQTAVCNLASVCLPAFIENNSFNFKDLEVVVEMIVKALDVAIDENIYPDSKTQLSNLMHRPIGIGVQGLADVFMKLQMSFESLEARTLNCQIFEVIYYSALSATLGGNQFCAADTCCYRIQMICREKLFSIKTEEEWKQLGKDLCFLGMRNSMLTTIMPTATTAQILGNVESIEPITSNIFIRSVLSGHFQVINECLVEFLQKENLWNDKIKQQLIKDRGSVKNLPILQKSKDVFKTSWEMEMKPLIMMAAQRQWFIDQSQSLNIFLIEPKVCQLSSLIMDCWELGLKTAIYYLRTRPARDPIQFTIKVEENEGEDAYACELSCEVCSA